MDSKISRRVELAHMHYSHPDQVFGKLIFTGYPLLDEYISSCLLTLLFAVIYYLTLSGLSYLVLYGWKHNKFTPNRQKMKGYDEKIFYDIKWSLINILGQTPLVTLIKMMYPYYSKVQYDWNLTSMFPIYFILHLVYDEFLTYWAHRLLHHPKIYDKLHSYHHESKAVTPFSGFAFHPIDAFIQAVPVFTSCYFIPLPIDLVLAHGLITSAWAISIHDNVSAIPFKGILFAGSHSIHHFPWGENYNYGKITSICDRLYGTYCDPIGITGYGYKCNIYIQKLINKMNIIFEKVIPDRGKDRVQRQSRKLAQQKWEKLLLTDQKKKE